MTESDNNKNIHNEEVNRDVTTLPITNHTVKKTKKSLSMHDGIAIWHDCCSCQAEPYWAKLTEEMEVDLNSDHEE